MELSGQNEHSLAVQEGVAGSILRQCGVEYDGVRIHPDTGATVPDTRVAAITRLAPVLARSGRLIDADLTTLRSVGIEV